MEVDRCFGSGRIALAGLAPILAVQAAAADASPATTTRSPKTIMTPDVVETRIGKLAR